MTLRLYGDEGNPRTRVVMIVAAARGIPLEIVRTNPRMNINKEALVAQFPRSGGKIPALEGKDFKLTEVMAIAMYLAKSDEGSGDRLLGDGSPRQEAEVLSWMSWVNQEVFGLLIRWFAPLVPGLADPPPYDYDAVEAGKAASLKMFDYLEGVLGGTTYLVGSSMTLADIVVAIIVSRGLEWVLDAKWRAQHPHIMRHFDMVAGWAPTKKVVPEFTLIEVARPNENPNA